LNFKAYIENIELIDMLERGCKGGVDSKREGFFFFNNDVDVGGVGGWGFAIRKVGATHGLVVLDAR
jgi:hypothetical protein